MEDVVQSTSPPARKAGGWRAIKYILGNESFEKLASMSLIANMTLYLQSMYNMGGVANVNITTIWSGSSNIVCLLGAFLADTYLGKFRTLLFGAISSLLGMGAMTLTAAIPKLRPPTCDIEVESSCPQPQAWQLGFLFVSLALLSIGAGGIRPCNIAFGADQFDTTTAKGRSQLESFFNWWYFSFTIALVIALTAVVYIQTAVSWIIGFAIPTACLFVSICVFLIGHHTYILKKPQGSIFSDMMRVLVAAFRKRRISIEPNLDHSFYEPVRNESELETARFVHTNRLRFLDKAAIIVDPNELDNHGKPKNAWRLCSLQQVEQLKCLVAIAPVWISGIACFIPMDQQNAFGILQAIQTNEYVGSHFRIPPAWMSLSSMIALSIWIFIYERVYIPQAKKMTGKNKRLTMQQRIKTGIVISILCMLVAAIVEKKRRESALKHGTFVSPMSIAVLLPQFVLSGLIEAFAAVAVMEFLTTHLPESMRTLAGAIFFLSLSVSSYCGTLLVNVIRQATKKNGKSWLGSHDLNKNKLDYYYYIIAGVGIINLLYFTFFASYFASNNRVGGSRREANLENPNASSHSTNISVEGAEEVEEELGMTCENSFIRNKNDVEQDLEHR